MDHAANACGRLEISFAFALGFRFAVVDKADERMCMRRESRAVVRLEDCASIKARTYIAHVVHMLTESVVSARPSYPFAFSVAEDPESNPSNSSQTTTSTSAAASLSSFTTDTRRVNTPGKRMVEIGARNEEGWKVGRILHALSASVIILPFISSLLQHRMHLKTCTIFPFTPSSSPTITS